MTTLAKNKVRTYEGTEEERNNLPVVASDIIYEGAAVGNNGSGYMRPLVAADPFAGFAIRKCDNASGSAGDKDVYLKTKGEVKLSVTGVTGVGDEGQPVYADDDDTFTLTSSSNSSIGKISRWISGTTCVVRFEGVAQRSI